MKKGLQRVCAITIASLMSLSNLAGAVEVSAQELETEVSDYEIYPTPQKTEYTGGSFNVGTDVNVIYESGIDIYTKNRVEEVLESHNINSMVSEEMVSGKTNFLIGINDSGESVDSYFNENVKHEESFFEKYDSNLVSVNDGVIGVLGNNTDSSFYGVTTLKHILNQLENNEIRNFRIDDYADVAYRGFIEGYYGNPWSNEDRAELMKYGGDYKLNQYIFAPKDDPYHNQKWRELYPAEKLAEISELARVGNETKNRYVYSLHPFMYNAIRFNTDENYEADLNVIKAKFSQLLEADVRQFGILADDAGVPPQGPSMYVRLLEDLTKWLVEQQATYPDLKTDLVFCPNDYMGNGSSAQLKEVNKAGDNVNIVMTGGRVWGEVSKSFTTNFINNIASEGNPGRAPYMWINWPCSDNSKQHLIMGGNDTFLHPGVDPNNIKGIVLNPMQQAEANKSALFAISDYGWNIWDNKEQADQNWEDSFKYMDHGTAEDTESSKSLREISRHMINQNMDSRVTVLQESVELAPKLNAFKEKYESGASIKEDATALITEFTKLKDAADYYKNNPGNERTRDQIIYWLKCWEDTMDAAIGYLNASIAIEDGDNDRTWTEFSKAQAAFEKSKTYGFHYVDHMEYAEVGVQHIVPFIRFMGQNLSNEVGSIVDPSKVITSYITNRTDTPTGSIDNVLDNKPATEIVYKTPNIISEGTYVGVKFSNQIDLNNIQFLMGTASNAKDTMAEAKLQYTEDGKNWVDLNDEIYRLAAEVKVENLDLKVKGVRLISTTTKTNTWLGVRDIVVNKKEAGDNSPLTPSVMRTAGWKVYSGSEGNLLDKNDSTDVWYNVGNGDVTAAGDYIGLDLGRNAFIGDIHFVLGRDGSADKWQKYKLEYSKDNINWITYKEYTGKASGKDIIDENLKGVEARYIRLTNLQELNKWVIFSELSVKEVTDMPTSNNVYTNVDAGLKSIYTNELTKLVPQENITLNKEEYIGVKLDRIKDLSKITLNISDNTGLQLQTSMNAIEWNNVTNERELNDARYVRLIQLGEVATTFNLVDFEVKSNELGEPSLVEAYTSSNTGAEKAFDGDLFSSVKFNAAPKRGDYILYDLGQNININNLKYTVLDTEKDHIRDGKIQLSLDGETWNDVITIGDGIENPEADLDSKPQDNGYIHGSLSGGTVPIALSYMEGENLNQEARYVRILFTAPYNYRWTVINEIMINNGEYIPTVNDPTYVSNPIEMKGFEPHKLRDGDLTTSYKPNTNNGEITSGSFTYRLSEKTDVSKINIIQNGNAISNAKVMVRTGYSQGGEEIWEQIGTLDKSLNEIVNLESNNIFEIKIEWDGIAPNIYEIITINDKKEPNNSKLKAKYDELSLLTGDIYTESSFEVLQEALKSADAVLKNTDASQKDIDDALEALIVAEESLVLEDKPETEIIVSKPSNLKSIEVTNKSVTLSWDAAEYTDGLVAYEIYKDGKLFDEVNSETRNYIVEDLRKNTNYGFKVVSKYSNGEKSKPISINVRTKK
ncbi:MAG: beta-N-acetylglucosaminidase domain-containing protein [Clostridium sp.]